jgi:hypothetical protein
MGWCFVCTCALRCAASWILAALRDTLTFGYPYIKISGRRFSWSETARLVSDPPNYVLSAADWLTLVEKFGLAADVRDAARKG